MTGIIDGCELLLFTYVNITFKMTLIVVKCCSDEIIEAINSLIF